MRGNTINNYYDANGMLKTSLYDVNGALITYDSNAFADSTTVTTVYTSTYSSHPVPEGGCIDDDGNVYVCYYQGAFLKYNIESGTETEFSFTSGAYGHANGMTYNPNTGYLYLAAMKNTGEVYVFDTSLNLVDTLYAKDANNTVFNCWNIAYDRLSRRFITLTGGTIYFFDDNFNLIKTASYNISDWTETRQDIETDGYYIYCVSHNQPYIYVFGMDGTHIKSITNSAFSGEPESLMYDWSNDVFYMEGMNNGWVIRRTEFRS